MDLKLRFNLRLEEVGAEVELQVAKVRLQKSPEALAQLRKSDRCVIGR